MAHLERANGLKELLADCPKRRRTPALFGVHAPHGISGATGRHRPDEPFAGWRVRSLLAPFAPPRGTGIGTCGAVSVPASTTAPARLVGCSTGRPGNANDRGRATDRHRRDRYHLPRAGHCVLLSGLPWRIGEMTSGGPARPCRRQRWVCAGLLEVAGSVSRLDRTVGAQAAEPGFFHHAAEDKTPTGPESDHPACLIRTAGFPRTQRRRVRAVARHQQPSGADRAV